MVFRLRKLNPPFGTKEAPLWEYAYSEQIKVVDGLCEVESETTRDYLLKLGYQEVKEEREPVAAGSPPLESSQPSPKRNTPPKYKRRTKKKRR